MKTLFRQSFVMFFLLSLITGIAYPILTTAIAQLAFPYQANGSIIENDGKSVGSSLIGQSFTKPEYFAGRPSATGPYPYNSMAGSGSNLAVSNPAQQDSIKQRAIDLQAQNPDATGEIPADLLTASASGLDPHISPEAANYQASRVAKARQLPVATIKSMIDRHTLQPTLGILGGPRVNVLELNRELDRKQNLR